ncbi:MAG: GTP-binding protein [Aggregatilineales bacterium]
MRTPPPNPIPLMIISGFLGAGKTTLLNHILSAEHGLKIAVLVNDFGAINIDSQLVVGVQGQTVTLSNGCICCTIRDDLKQEVLRLFELSEPPEYVIIETSGVSDPVAVAATFHDPELRARIRVDCILTVVDADTILENLDLHDGLARAQISVADIVLVNKVDLVDAVRLDAIRHVFEDIIPQAHILTAENARVPLELVIETGRFQPETLTGLDAKAVHVHSASAEAHQHGHELIFDTWSWMTSEPLSLGKFGEFIEQLPKSIVRVKGLLCFEERPGQIGELHIVGNRATLKMRVLDEGQSVDQSQIVFIGTHEGVDVHLLETTLNACIVDVENLPL